ncbi:terminase TerL endonuclease subunit [Pantoea stewartii]
MVQFGQGYKDMAPAIDTLEGALLNGKIRHANHPVMNMCAANATVIRDAAGNRKIDKSKKQAAWMAWWRWLWRWARQMVKALIHRATLTTS